jgi:biopolymer transport protein ExbB/TolQ
LKGFTRDKKFVPINNTRKKKKCIGDACKIQSEKQFDKNLGVVLKKFDKTRKATFEEQFDEQAGVVESALNREFDKKVSKAESHLNKGAGILESAVDQAVVSAI